MRASREEFDRGLSAEETPPDYAACDPVHHEALTPEMPSDDHTAADVEGALDSPSAIDDFDIPDTGADGID